MTTSTVDPAVLLLRPARLALAARLKRFKRFLECGEAEPGLSGGKDRRPRLRLPMTKKPAVPGKG